MVKDRGLRVKGPGFESWVLPLAGLVTLDKLSKLFKCHWPPWKMGFTGGASGVSRDPSSYQEMMSDYLLYSKCSINVIVTIIISLSLGFQSSSPPPRFLSLGAFRAWGTRSVLGEGLRRLPVPEIRYPLPGLTLSRENPSPPLQPTEMCGGQARPPGRVESL